MKISYLGPNGTFSEQAALKYFGPINDFYLGETIFDVIGAVGEAKVDKGIVPLENTIEGTINFHYICWQTRNLIKMKSMKSGRYRQY